MSSARSPSTCASPTSSTCRTTSSRRYCRRRSSTAIESLRDTPAGFCGKILEEADIVGALRRLPDHFVDLVRILANEDAPFVGLDPVENDCRRLGRARRRVLAKAALALGYHIPNVLVGQIGRVSAHRGDARPGLRDLPRTDLVGQVAALNF